MALKLCMQAEYDGPTRLVLLLPAPRQTAIGARRLKCRYILFKIYEEHDDVAATSVTSPEDRRFSRMRGPLESNSVPDLADQSFVVSLQSPNNASVAKLFA